ncbi:hypothetical protein SO694_00004062 [Aureococcus anophagefferens]|uniref:Galactose oxidase-like Early set domain-containing protein n=1 Tax=Aureococcus anophagefferens TaxID=44056 RepID=A0ABR1G8P3_AURAN
MVRTLILALALSATDGFAPATKGIQRVAPMNMETMPYSSPAAQSSSGPLGLGPRESPKNAPGADSTILVQGGSLRTWSYKSPLVNQLRPFSCVIATPRGPNTVAIRNIGQMEFPIAAGVHANDVENPSAETAGSATTIQGGALRTYPFDPLGPNNNKQVIELYTEDGLDRPFFAILETPGSGNVVRIVNTAPVEFPMTPPPSCRASIDDKMASGAFDGDVVIGGDIGW